MAKQQNIYEKLLEIQKKVMGLGKDKEATSYKYVTGDKVLDNIKPLMNEYGLLLKQEVLSIDNERQNYIVSAGTPRAREKSEIHSKVMMKFTWVDCATGEKDENLFGANGQNDWDKGVGSALTYGERYFLLKYFHIATDEDDIDNPTRKPEEAEPTSPAQPTKQPAKTTPKQQLPAADKPAAEKGKDIADPPIDDRVNSMLGKRPEIPAEKTEAAPVTQAELIGAEKEIAAAPDVPTLIDIWNKYPNMHTDVAFNDAMSVRKAAIKAGK